MESLLNPRAISCAPIYCPGRICHMCFTSKKERDQFVEERCNRKCARLLPSCCRCCNSDKRDVNVQWNTIPLDEMGPNGSIDMLVLPSRRSTGIDVIIDGEGDTQSPGAATSVGERKENGKNNKKKRKKSKKKKKTEFPQLSDSVGDRKKKEKRHKTRSKKEKDGIAKIIAASKKRRKRKKMKESVEEVDLT